MSGAQTSTFSNVLYDPLMASRQSSAENQLLIQQQDIGGHEIEMGARLAGTLLSSYDTPEARAAAYPTLLAQARSVAPGYFKNAPATYPGDEPTRALARLGTPSQTQQEWGFNLAANKAYTAATNPPATAPASSVAPATGGVAGDGLTGDKAHDLPLIAQRESGGSPTVLNYVAQQDPTAYARGATASGKYQIVNSTWREGLQLAGLDPAQYATARDAPEQVQDKVASAIYDKYGGKPWQKGPQDWVKDEQGRYQMATVRPAAGAPGGAPSVTAPGASTAPGTPAPYRVASNAPVPPPASTAPAAQPSYVDRETGLPVIGTQPGAPAVTAQPQAQVPQPPANRSMPGGADGPPAATPPPAPSAPAGGPQPPQLAPLNAAGLTPIQQRQIDAYAADPRVPLDKRIAAQQAFANQNIQLQQKAFSDWIQVQQLQTSQGQLSVSQQNSALEYWKAAHPDAKVTSVGGEIITQDPRNGREIAPRIQVGMDRPEAQAAAVVARLGPRIAAADAGTGPPVTPEERADYATQVGIYRNPKVMTDPITKGLIHVNERELPPGFPEPGGPGGVGGGPQKITPGMSPAQQEVEKKLGENFADQDTKAYAGANNSLYALGQMNNASEILDKQGGSAWTATGPAANLRIATAQGVNTLGSLFGVAPTFDPAAIGSWEALNKQTKLMGFKIINAAFGASREAASVINNATSAVPSAENTYLGFRLVSSGIEQELQRERELYEFKADRVRGGEPLATAEADFNKTHPIDVYTSRAIANAVPDDIAGYLVAHPDTVKAFDGHFGPGTGEFILKGGRTGLGQAARGR